MKKILFFSFLILFTSNILSASIENNIVKIIVKLEKGDIHQSGFYTKINTTEGEKLGIITALHGVTSLDNIYMQYNKGSYISLNLEYADIEKDTAFLTINGKKPKNLIPISVYNNPKLPTKIKIAGYPMGFNTYSIRNAEISKPQSQTLGSFGILNRKRWDNRNSPSLSTIIININGSILPGDSGSLISTMDDKLIAIGNGGFKYGTIGLGWAIPWKDLHFSAIKKNKILELNNDKSFDKLFFFKETRKEGNTICASTDLSCWKNWTQEAKSMIEVEISKIDKEIEDKCNYKDLDKKGACVFYMKRTMGNRIASCTSVLSLLKNLNNPFYCSENKIYDDENCTKAKNNMAKIVRVDSNMCQPNTFKVNTEWQKILEEDN